MSQRLWMAVLLGAMAVWFLPLGSYRLFDPDEGRYAEIPREMVASGDWVTPRLDGDQVFREAGAAVLGHGRAFACSASTPGARACGRRCAAFSACC